MTVRRLCSVKLEGKIKQQTILLGDITDFPLKFISVETQG